MSENNFGIPVTGGTAYTTATTLDATESIIRSYASVNNTLNDIAKKLDAQNYTYPLWFLLQQQADYFVSLLPFITSDKQTTEAIFKTIRVGVIYGNSALWNTQGGLIPLYINQVWYDNIYGYPLKMKCALADQILATKQLTPQSNNWVTFESGEFNNVYIFNSSSTGFGGLVRWLPFLKQLENILKMLYTHSYSFLKFITYEVKDPAFLNNELELFFNTNTPFLINVGDNSLISNKFKEFNFGNSDKNAFFEYLKNFLNTYYSLIGRRYNIDYKKERNVTSEVEASQDNFNILQYELRSYVKLMLDWIISKTGKDIKYDF